MRSPAEVAKEIRTELAKLAKKRSDYSVQAKSGYKIEVKVNGIDFETAKKVTEEVYHREDHHFLCVSVNNYWLPMPPLKVLEIMK